LGTVALLRKIFGPKREEVTGEWGNLHNELFNLYSSPNIFGRIKSKRMRRARYDTCNMHGREEICI
jgi:hypothetical protein